MSIEQRSTPGRSFQRPFENPETGLETFIKGYVPRHQVTYSERKTQVLVRRDLATGELRHVLCKYSGWSNTPKDSALEALDNVTRTTKTQVRGVLIRKKAG